VRSFWLRMQDHAQYFRAAILNPIVTTTTPPYYSATTYHLRQIYGSTVALKSAPSNLRFTVVLLAEPALWLPCILPLPQEL
jgi:hypothetical protein